MGDVHPHALKAQLLTELSRWAYDDGIEGMLAPVARKRKGLLNSPKASSAIPGLSGGLRSRRLIWPRVVLAWSRFQALIMAWATGL